MAVRMRADIYLPIDPGAGAPRQDPRVRVIGEGGEQQPRVIYLRDREPEPITIVRERASGQRIRYVERGGEEGSFEEERVSSRRRSSRREEREEFEEEGEEPIRRKSAQRKSLRQELIETYKETGESVLEFEGRYYEVFETRSGRLDVAEVGEPARERDIMPVRRSERSSRVFDERDDRRSAPAEAPKSGGGIGRTLARVAGWGLLGVGAVFAFGGIMGPVTHGATFPVYGRLWPTMQQAIWPLGFGVASLAAGGVLLKATKKKK